MKPTDEQLTAINSQLQFNRRDLMRERNLSLIGETIAEWESIRQPDDRQLVRTNHELAEQLAGVRKELAELKVNLSDANAVRINMLRGTIAWTPETLRSVLGEPPLPEWIPVGERMPAIQDAECGEVLQLADDGCIYLASWNDLDNVDYWLPPAAITNLPKRQPAPKPTAEEVEEQEMNAAWIVEWEGPNVYQESDRITFEAGWKAARASKEEQV